MANNLIAPNGKPSNLSAEQYALVRTPEFKAWFGDWENDPQNASKVVDDNGEPMVVFHGAEIFNKNEIGRFDIFRKGSYFTDTYKSAKYYAFKLAYGITDVKESDTEIYNVFLNIRNPKTFDYENDEAEDYFWDFDENDKRIDKYISDGYDGVLWEHKIKMYDTSIKELEKHFINFSPNQVKLADGSNTTFDAANPDIRYADGGKVDFGEVLFGEDKAVSALQPKGLTRIEPNTEDENKLQKALYDYTQSSLNKDSIIKNKSLLESAANQFPQLLRPKISPFDNNFLFRGVSFSEDNKDNIIKMLGISIEKPFGDDVIQFSNEDSNDKNAGSSVVYGKYFQNADFGIKDFEFTSWTTDYKIAKRFNRSTGFIYAVSFEKSDDLYLRPKLSNAVSSFRENEMLFYNEGKGISTKRVDKDSILVRYIYILYSADNLARLLDTDIYTVRANINARPILEGSTSESALQHDLNILNKDKLQEDWFKKGGLSRTPAPKKDRVFGSDKNKVGSAASKESAKKINLSEDIITTLSNKAKEYNEENSGNKVTLNTLKAVMRRGMGAYSTSHRPTITGGAPNSRQAWGFARVNKFLKKKSGEKVKAAYVQDDDLLEMGGTINKNNLKMIQQHYHSMKPIEDIQVGDIYVIKEDMFAPHQDHEHPQHLSTRYATVEVKSPCHRNLDSYTLEVMECDCDNAAGRYAKGKVIERSRKHILSSGKLKSAVAKATEFKDGGELNADSQEVKEYFAHDSGNAGGLLVGKRHSEGGIKADVKSTGQQIEMEGGEAVITRGAVNSKKKYVYEGKEMTTREILSDLNVKGGGVAFADGGDVPDKINCGCSSMKVGGISYTPQDFITLSEKEYQEHRLIDGIEKERKDHFYTLAKLNSGAISIEQALREIATKEMMIDPKYPYSE